MNAAELVKQYDELTVRMDEHLAGPTEEDEDDGFAMLVCGCVKSKWPESEDRCDVFAAMARERWQIHERIFELLRADQTTGREPSDG